MDGGEVYVEPEEAVDGKVLGLMPIGFAVGRRTAGVVEGVGFEGGCKAEEPEAGPPLP